MRFRLRGDASSVGALMSELAQSLHTCMQHFAQALSPDPAARRAALAELRAGDFEAQNLAHSVLSGLAASFVTPFDRGDVYQITWALRRATARIEAAGDCLDLLVREDLPIKLPSMVHLMVRSTELVTGIVARLNDPGALAPALIELGMVSKQAAQMHRQVVVDVTNDSDPSRMARHLELVDSLRRVVDAVEAVGDTVLTVVVRES